MICPTKVVKKRIKSRELVSILESNGWHGKQGKSSHLVYRHPRMSKILSFPYKGGGEEISVGLLGKIQRLSGLKLRP